MKLLQCLLFTTVYIWWVNGVLSPKALKLLKGRAVYPEVFLNATQLIQYNGYRAENYGVTTDDGFILGTQRIPQGRHDKPGGPARPVVLLQHGLSADSDSFLFNGQNASLAFFLADAGYDVWLGNSRGNTYSMKHTKYNTSQEEFWDFSWQDMAYKDLPATVDFILKHTNQSDLVYVGHSQGTCIGFAGFSRNQDLAKKIKLFIALAPIGKVQNIRGLLELILKPFRDDLDAVYKLLGRKGMMLNSSINMDIAEKICDTEASALVCNQFTNLLYGPGLSDADLNRVPVYMSHVPCGTSVRNVVHFAQEVISGQFQLYEFGSAAVNMMHYNQTTPPFVDLKQINVPVALYSGSNDWLADPTDVKFISSNLKKIVEQKEYAKWNHVDFIVGNTAPKTLYVDMLKLMKTYI